MPRMEIPSAITEGIRSQWPKNAATILQNIKPHRENGTKFLPTDPAKRKDAKFAKQGNAALEYWDCFVSTAKQELREAEEFRVELPSKLGGKTIKPNLPHSQERVADQWVPDNGDTFFSHLSKNEPSPGHALRCLEAFLPGIPAKQFRRTQSMDDLYHLANS